MIEAFVKGLSLAQGAWKTIQDKAVGAASALERTGEQFSERAMNAASSMENMSAAYENASSAVGSLGNTASEISGTYRDQMNALTNNVNALNEMYELELQKREQAKSDAHGAKTEIGWGHQIRSYVLAPYQMIKDLRTNIETNQSDKVLNGDIDMFLEGALAYKLGKETI